MTKDKILRIALPSKGALANGTINLLSACGLAVSRPNERQYFGSIPALPQVKVLFQRAAGRQRIFKEPGQMLKVIQDYFVDQELIDKPATVSGLCLALGFKSRTTWYNYRNNQNYKAFWEVMDWAMMKVLESHEVSLLKGEGSAAGNIFLLKNHFGMKDKVDYDITTDGESLKPKQEVNYEVFTDEELDQFIRLKDKLAEGKAG